MQCTSFGCQKLQKSGEKGMFLITLSGNTHLGSGKLVKIGVCVFVFWFWFWFWFCCLFVCLFFVLF